MVATREADAHTRDLIVPTSDDERVVLVRWTERIDFWIGVAIVAACCIYVFVQLQPRLLFLDTTAAGGDTGAHVWFPAYLRDFLLPNFRLAGWSPDYYAGFPAGQFYFPVPALLTVFLDLFIPYNIAFKLVTAVGPILLPISAYVFGRGIRAPRPAPAFFAIGATAFLFFKDGGDSVMKFDHHIMGGTLTSTLAGEFSFTIALACALFFLGTLARALDGEGALWIPAVLFAATLMSHLVVGVFAVYAALVIWLIRRPLRTAGRAAAIVVVGGLLTAVWTLPLVATIKYTTDMRYEPIGDPASTSGGYLNWMFISEMWFLFPLGIAAIAGGIWFRRRATLDLVAIGVVAGLVFYGWEGLRDVFGKAPAWNLRLLPFWYLMLYLVAALGAAEIVRLVGRFTAWVAYGTEDVFADRDARREVAVTESGSGSVRDPVPERVHDPDVVARSNFVRVVTVALVGAVLTTIALVRINDTRGYLPYWAKYNYTGYEGGTPEDFTEKSYPELRAFMDTAAELAPGRMLWEGSSQIGAYGTPLALMLLPYFTDERIPTLEGLYYEAAASTPYHFMAAATLMQEPSNAVRGIPYRTLVGSSNQTETFALGVEYLQLMGVRYFAATTDLVKGLADANASLREVATVPDLDAKQPSGWTIYEVDDSALVAPLAYQPVVVDGMKAERNWKCEGKPPPPKGSPTAAELSAWECTAVPWFDDPAALDRPLTGGGPAAWQHTQPENARDARRIALDPVEVSRIRSTEDTIEFDVSRTGVPVLVKASYYPNWKVDGADGPWRATPNFMVVVPTSKHVTLEFGTTAVEWVGRLGTLLGVVGVGLLVWWGWTATGGLGPGSGWGSRRRPTLRFTSPPSASSLPPDSLVDVPADSERKPPIQPLRPPLPDADLDTIFKAYDIRGVYPDEIDEEVARRVGNAFVAFTGAARVLVGRDARPSSEPLVAAFSEGATMAGADIVDLGVASTDLCYFAAGTLDSPAAMFTASHNPAEYNGIKLCRAGAGPIGEDTGLREIKGMLAAGMFERAEDPGRAERLDLLPAFVAHVHSFVDVGALAALRVVTDTANGVGGLIVSAVFSRLPFDLTMLYADLDGTFPNHPADPIQVENLKDLARAVVDGDASVGLAFDGDADRVVLVDDLGQPVSGSTTTAILAAAILARNPGEKVVHNLICSKAVPEVITENGGVPVRSRVGHSFIKQVMAETGAVFGGEHSAHYYFRDNFRADSGIIAALMVLEQLSITGQPLSELRKPYERYAMSGEINSRVDDPPSVIDRVAEVYASAEQDRLDGLTVYVGDWWFNLRPSNTEPLLRLNLEAGDRDECDAHTAEVLAIVRDPNS